MHHSILSRDTTKLAKAHEDVGRHRGSGVIGFLEESAEHGKCIWLDQSLGGADKQGEESGAFFAVPPEEPQI
jgi:hypothetical protein